MDAAIRRPSAFVAASAQQIIARREELLNKDQVPLENISRSRLAPEMSAVLLFLAAEQYADANEAALRINIGNEPNSSLVSVISHHIVDLATGSLESLIRRGTERQQDGSLVVEGASLEESAMAAMLETLALGIERLAHSILVTAAYSPNEQTPRLLFERVLGLSARAKEWRENARLEISYPGIHHLASLLISVCDGITESVLTKLPPPAGSDATIWSNWLAYRAKKFPYIWPNHREALAQGFHLNGTSAVLVLPTGAGKTTVSSIKIASVLAQGKKVVFLAPTHALSEQLTVDLQEMFPQEILGASVSNDFDLLFRAGAVLPEIEVMTPERCLAMLSFSPESFQDVGLLVFDECHILSPESGKIRRSLDGMLCLLSFNKVAPSADMLFLSAMVKNGQELSEWLSASLNRACISVDLLWKPSRQARGVVLYRQADVEAISNQALITQQQLDAAFVRPARNIRAAALRELQIQPHAIWGLQHNWLDTQQNIARCSFTRLIDGRIQLSGGLNNGRLQLKPNVNNVAASIAEISLRQNLKTIIFVNQKSHAISTAKSISQSVGSSIPPSDEENLRWEALKQELGDLKHSILTKGAVAVPHNASMLRLERELAERSYRRSDGAMVIVATPTLAQGLNLPAQLAILAGDKRAETENGGRETLEAHELLNAAARAGRAGHLANGIVLLIPEPVLSFAEGQALSGEVVQKLQALIPEDDRCVNIADPLGVVLDRISAGDVADRDVLYVVNRLATLNDSSFVDDQLFNLSRSFAAYVAGQRNEAESFVGKLNALSLLVQQNAGEDIDQSLSMLASQSGLPPHILLRLKARVSAEIGNLPITTLGWIEWVVRWLQADAEAKDLLLFDVRRSVLGAAGMNKDGELTDQAVADILPGIQGWVSGMPICEIEVLLGGDPDSSSDTVKVCPRARELIGVVLPRGFAFIMGLVTRIVSELNPYAAQQDLVPMLIDSLSSSIRLGYDSPQKLAFAIAHPELLSRVAIHKEYSSLA